MEGRGAVFDPGCAEGAEGGCGGGVEDGRGGAVGYFEDTFTRHTGK